MCADIDPQSSNPERQPTNQGDAAPSSDSLEESQLSPSEFAGMQALREELRTKLQQTYQQRQEDPGLALELLSELFEQPNAQTPIKAAILLWVSDIYGKVGVPCEGAIIKLKELEVTAETIQLVEAHLQHGCRLESFHPKLARCSPEQREIYQTLIGAMAFDANLDFLADPKTGISYLSLHYNRLFAASGRALKEFGATDALRAAERGQELGTTLSEALAQHQYKGGEELVDLLELAFMMEEVHLSRLSKVIKSGIRKADEKEETEHLRVALRSVRALNSLLEFNRDWADRELDDSREGKRIAPLPQIEITETFLQLIEQSKYSKSNVALKRIDLFEAAARRLVPKSIPLRKLPPAVLSLKGGGELHARDAVMNMAQTDLPPAIIERLGGLIPKCLYTMEMSGVLHPVLVQTIDPNRFVTFCAKALDAGVDSQKLLATLAELDKLPLSDSSKSEQNKSEISKICDPLIPD